LHKKLGPSGTVKTVGRKSILWRQEIIHAPNGVMGGKNLSAGGLNHRKRKKKKGCKNAGGGGDGACTRGRVGRMNHQ